MEPLNLLRTCNLPWKTLQKNHVLNENYRVPKMQKCLLRKNGTGGFSPFFFEVQLHNRLIQLLRRRYIEECRPWEHNSIRTVVVSGIESILGCKIINNKSEVAVKQ